MTAIAILSLFTTLKGIIATVCAAASGIIWLLVRRAKQQDDPQNQYETAKAENAKIIQSGDADALARALDADLNRVSSRAAIGSPAGKPNP